MEVIEREDLKALNIELFRSKLYSDEELRKLLSGHLCRCTGYENILKAVKKTMYRRLGMEVPAI